MYAPQLGRFCSRDPLGYRSGLGLFAYALNRPTIFIDPSGLKCEWQDHHWIPREPNTGQLGRRANSLCSAIFPGFDFHDFTNTVQRCSGCDRQCDFHNSLHNNPDVPWNNLVRALLDTSVTCCDFLESLSFAITAYWNVQAGRIWNSPRPLPPGCDLNYLYSPAGQPWSTMHRYRQPHNLTGAKFAGYLSRCQERWTPDPDPVPIPLPGPVLEPYPIVRLRPGRPPDRHWDVPEIPGRPVPVPVMVGAGVVIAVGIIVVAPEFAPVLLAF